LLLQRLADTPDPANSAAAAAAVTCAAAAPQVPTTLVQQLARAPAPALTPQSTPPAAAHASAAGAIAPGPSTVKSGATTQRSAPALARAPVSATAPLTFAAPVASSAATSVSPASAPGTVHSSCQPTPAARPFLPPYLRMSMPAAASGNVAGQQAALRVSPAAAEQLQAPFQPVQPQDAATARQQLSLEQQQPQMQQHTVLAQAAQQHGQRHQQHQ
jgi:hypothetical protein